MNQTKTIYKWDNPVLANEIDRIIAAIYLRAQKRGLPGSRQTGPLGDMRGSKRGGLFMFCGCSPKAGTTTLAISTALAIADSGWKTLLIDTDIRKDPAFKRLGSNGTFLAEYLNDKTIPVQNIIQSTNFADLDYVPSGATDSNPMRLLCSEQTRLLFAFAKERYDYVIIDAPSPGAAVDACVLAPLVDETILVLEWDVTGKSQAARTKAGIENAGGKIMGSVINRMPPTAYMHYNRDSMYFINRDYITSESEKHGETDPHASWPARWKKQKIRKEEAWPEKARPKEARRAKGS